MAQYEIPLTAQAQRFAVDILGRTCTVRVQYAVADQGGWFLDITDESGTDLVCGVPLVSGVDLLAQHRHLGLGVKLWMTATPTYAELGASAKLIFEAL